MVAFITSPIDTLLQGATRARAPGRTCTAVPTLPCKHNSRCDLRETKLAPNTRWGSRSRDPIGYVDGLSGLYLVDIYLSAVDPTGNQKVLPGDGPIVPANAKCFVLADVGKKTTQQRFETCIVFVPQCLILRWGKREYTQECVCKKTWVPGIPGLSVGHDVIHWECENKNKGACR